MVVSELNQKAALNPSIERNVQSLLAAPKVKLYGAEVNTIMRIVLLIFLLAGNYASALELPRNPEHEYSTVGIAQCVHNGTLGLRDKFNELEKNVVQVTWDLESIAPIILEQRRIQEHWCKVEEECASESASENKAFVYGEIFTSCIRQVSK